MNTIKTARMERVQRFMREKQLDAVLVSNCSIGNCNTWLLASEGMPLHLPYNRNNLCLVTADGQIQQLCAREPHPTDWLKFPLITQTSMPQSLTGGRLGLVNPSYLKKCVRDYLLQACPGIVLVDVDEEFHLLQAEKTAEEVAGVAAAVRQFDRVFSTMPLLLTGEPLEREVVVSLRNRMREMDAECEDLATSTMVTLTSAPDGGYSVPEPIAWPGRRLEAGDRVNVLVNGFMPGGFASALGRTYVLGEPSAETVQFWNLAVQAQNLLAAAARPGSTIAELMTLLDREILHPNGLPLETCNQIYGIGTGAYEMPRNVDRFRNRPLEKNMTLVIAPVLRPTGKDPYCCMDPFVVTENGAKRLSTTEQTLCVLD